MTAPTPSSPGGDRPQQYDPWAPHPSGGPQQPAPAPVTGGPAGHGTEAPGHGSPHPGPGTGLPWGREAREAALVGVAVALSGVVLGLLWLWLAPRVPLISDGRAVYLKHPEGEQAVGADGTFVLLGLAVGAVAGAAAFLFRRDGGVGPVAGLLLGGLVASLLAWWLGVSLGPGGDLAARAEEVGEGTAFDGPLELKGKAALLALPFGAVAAHLLCTGMFGKRDPEPPPPHGW